MEEKNPLVKLWKFISLQDEAANQPPPTNATTVLNKTQKHLVAYRVDVSHEALMLLASMKAKSHRGSITYLVNLYRGTLNKQHMDIVSRIFFENFQIEKSFFGC